MKKTLLFALSLFVFITTQATIVKISGKVIDENSGLPIEFACVFISQTTQGTYANQDGEFKLAIEKNGAINLVVSHVSYETYSEVIHDLGDSAFFKIKLKPREFKIPDVNVSKKDPYRTNKIKLFNEGLLGRTKNSYKCQILNPSAVNLIAISPENPNWTLYAFADSFVKIKNETLGYSINYNLVYYVMNNSGIKYFGYPFFVDHNNNISNRIKKMRKLTFEGSKLHFFRSLFNHTLEKQGFEIYKVIQKLKDTANNINYGLMEDSVFIGKKNIVLQQTNEKIDLYTYISTDTNRNLKYLSISEPFEIRYTKKEEENLYGQFEENYKGIKRNDNAQTTIIRLKPGKIIFYENGSYEKVNDLITIGYWNYKKLADFLPYNYILNE
jgi:hypothetical protein